jgi:hypothetical protein
MANITGLAHLRVLCKITSHSGSKKPEPSATELQKRFDSMRKIEVATIPARQSDDKADDLSIINSLNDFFRQEYIIEHNGVLITHLLDNWERPPKHTGKFKGSGRKLSFQKFCANHPGDFEVFTWQDENDSVRGTRTTELHQRFAAMQKVDGASSGNEEGDGTEQPADDEGSESICFSTQPDALVQQMRQDGYGAATPSCNPLLSQPKTPPMVIKSLGCSSRAMPPRPPLPPQKLEGLPPPPMPPQRRGLPTPPPMPVP